MRRHGGKEDNVKRTYIYPILPWQEIKLQRKHLLSTVQMLFVFQTCFIIL